MKKRFLKEIYWLIGAIVITILLGFSLFGERLFVGGTFEIQLHDTFLSTPKMVALL
ncbi:hypothetical protein V6R21_19350 [Limibacter armeniacum]|uniref:hypothetical protein n=1 Tax=Limibacter armeniacum TaxID=466084 RepID=UPI002FE52DD4